MSLLLSEKLAISSIFPRQKGGSRTPSNSKYLLSNSIGVLGVSASLSAILETSRQCNDNKTRTPTRTVFCFGFFLEGEDDGDEADLMCPSLRDAEAGRRWTSRPTANQAGEKWCNARARLPASGPLSPGWMRTPAKEKRFQIHFKPTDLLQRERLPQAYNNIPCSSGFIGHFILFIGSH